MRLFVAAIFLMGSIFALAPSSFGASVDSGVPGMALDHNTPVTMTDGLQLRVNVYRPDKPGQFPVLMLMGPYGKDTSYVDAPAYKESWAKLLAKYPDLTKKSSCRYLRFESPDPERWVQDGYIVIAADSRGTGASPGMLDPFSPREIEDYATLITWASRQPWSTGKVGLLGTSYNGWWPPDNRRDWPPSFHGKAHSITTARSRSLAEYPILPPGSSGGTTRWSRTSMATPSRPLWTRSRVKGRRAKPVRRNCSNRIALDQWMRG